MDALKAMDGRVAGTASENGVGAGGGCDVGEEVVVRLISLEERGLHRDWRATSKKWALAKNPRLTSSYSTLTPLIATAEKGAGRLM